MFIEMNKDTQVLTKVLLKLHFHLSHGDLAVPFGRQVLEILAPDEMPDNESDLGTVLSRTILENLMLLADPGDIPSAMLRRKELSLGVLAKLSDDLPVILRYRGELATATANLLLAFAGGNLCARVEADLGSEVTQTINEYRQKNPWEKLFLLNPVDVNNEHSWRGGPIIKPTYGEELLGKIKAGRNLYFAIFADGTVKPVAGEDFGSKDSGITRNLLEEMSIRAIIEAYQYSDDQTIGPDVSCLHVTLYK